MKSVCQSLFVRWPAVAVKSQTDDKDGKLDSDCDDADSDADDPLHCIQKSGAVARADDANRLIKSL